MGINYGVNLTSQKIDSGIHKISGTNKDRQTDGQFETLTRPFYGVKVSDQFI